MNFEEKAVVRAAISLHKAWKAWDAADAMESRAGSPMESLEDRIRLAERRLVTACCRYKKSRTPKWKGTGL